MVRNPNLRKQEIIIGLANPNESRETDFGPHSPVRLIQHLDGDTSLVDAPIALRLIKYSNHKLPERGRGNAEPYITLGVGMPHANEGSHVHVEHFKVQNDDAGMHFFDYKQVFLFEGHRGRMDLGIVLNENDEGEDGDDTAAQSAANSAQHSGDKFIGYWAWRPSKSPKVRR